MTLKKLFPSLPRFEPKSYDHSAVKLAKECFRKYFYRIILGRVAPVSKYQVVFDFGSAYHKFREVLELEYQRLGDVDMACALAMSETLKMKLHKGEGKYEFYTKQRLVDSCLVAFDKFKLEKAQGRIKVIAVEQPINVQLPNGKFISGRADQIVEWNGQLWGRDWKTTAKMLQYFADTLDPNDQATRYVYMESKLHYGSEAVDNGKHIRGIIFEVLQNTKTTKPKIENVLITKNHFQLKAWEQEELFYHNLIDNCTSADMWPMSESACSFCDYKKVCKAPSEASMENILKNEYLLSPWDHEKVQQEVIKDA